MSESVVLPALGESVTEGTVTRWLKKVGDSVAVDEPLVEVSTDKVDTEIPSPVAGVIEQILVQEDETVQVGAVLVIISGGSGAASSPAAPAAADPVAQAPVAQAPVAPPVAPAATAPVVTPVAAPIAPPVSTPMIYTPAAPVAPVVPVVAPVATPAAPVAAPSVPVTTATDAGYVTPLVRKLAQDSGVDLTRLVGTGVGGRIRKEDVLSATSGSNSSIPSASAIHVPAPVSAQRGTSEPMSRLRKVLAERAVASMVSSAQLTTVVEVDVTKIAEMRKSVQPADRKSVV